MLLKNAFYGFLSWLIPFACSFLFYTREGRLLVDAGLFKSIMVAIGSISAAFLLVAYFRGVRARYRKEGIVVGLSWLAMNIVLDLAILVPMSGMPVSDYLAQIGLRYLAIPAMSIAVGAALANRTAERIGSAAG
jgi:uncharacterized membrane protein YpjA